MKKVVLITGGSGDIGCETALLFAKNGYNIALCYNNNESKAVEIKKQIENLGCECLIIKADFSKVVSNIANRVFDKYKRLDTLINCAGIDSIKMLIDCSDKEIDNILTVNLSSQIKLTRDVAKIMLNQRYGSIVNISSIWGVDGASCESIYSASKGGIISFTKALSKELAPYVRVNCVAPGATNTKMNDNLTQKEKEEFANNNILLKRFAQPYEIAEAIYFISNHQYITGQTLVVDGGTI